MLFLPLAATTMAAHWSVVRSRGHYPSDVFAGGVIAVGLALVAWRLWPPGPGDAGGSGPVGRGRTDEEVPS